MPSRTTVAVTTASIAAGSNALVSATGFKGYNLYSIQVNQPAWVTVYSSTSARTADLSRAKTTDPTPGTGVLAEIISNVAVTQLFSPGVVCYSSESPATTSIPLKIYNNGNSTVAITATLTLLQTEQ